ncbi:hypothetical protein [Embleya sp. NPDC001921]
MSERAAPTGPPITSPAVHRFADTTDAYDATQCRDDIEDGDVLVIESEGVVAFLYRAWPAALTQENGGLHTLTENATEADDGRYAATVRVAREQAEALGLALHTRHTPKPEPKPKPAPFAIGDRILCPDGHTRTVSGAHTAVGGREWVLVEAGAAWPVAKCERIDTSRVAQACKDARVAAASLNLETDAAYDLGEALRYLAQAAPAVLVELAEEARSRTRIEIPLLAVAPTDILHIDGARLTLLDVGIAANDGGQQRWWATFHGVTEEDRRAFYGVPQSLCMYVDYAAGKWVDVERIAPGVHA